MKKAIDAASDAVVAKACADIEAEQSGAHNQLEQAGISFDATDDAAVPKIKGQLAQVAKDWVALLDCRGKPGRALKKSTARPVFT